MKFLFNCFKNESFTKEFRKISLVYLESHRAELNSTIAEIDWSKIVSRTLDEQGFANANGFHYAQKLDELMRDVAYGAGVHIDRGSWIAENLDRLLPVFTHIVDTTLTALDARMVEEKPSDMSIAIAKRRLAAGLFDEDDWPTICDTRVHRDLVRDLRAVVDYAADGPGASGGGRADDPAEWLAKAKAWTAAVTIDEDPNEVAIARFGNGFRAILLSRPETIRAQSHAMGRALLTEGHPLHERTSTNLMRQFGLLDECSRPIATLYVDDGCLAASEIGPAFPEGLSITPFKIVVSNAARVLESLHGIHDLEQAYRQVVPDGEYCHSFRVPSFDYYDDERWYIKVNFRDMMVQNGDRHAVQIVKQQYQYGDGYSTSHSIEYYRKNLRHRGELPAYFTERTVAWFNDGVQTAMIDTKEYFAKARTLAG